MKITKISQNYQDEGHNIEEQPNSINDRKEVEEMELGKKEPTYTAELLNKMTTSIGPRINSAYVANGSVAWIKYNDIIYEVTVSPAYHGQHFNYFKNLQQKNTENEIDPTDNLPM